jgi:hypothetical protein
VHLQMHLHSQVHLKDHDVPLHLVDGGYQESPVALASALGGPKGRLRLVDWGTRGIQLHLQVHFECPRGVHLHSQVQLRLVYGRFADLSGFLFAAGLS